jgi:hypothetical protein
MKTKRLSSVALITMILLSLTMTFGIPTTTAQTTYVSVINPDTGDGNFIYDTTSPPPGNVFTVNITVTDVTNLAGWQVNLTFDPTLLTIAAPADVYAPADHIFNGLDPQFPAKDINNPAGYVFWSAAIGPASPSDHFTGSGRMMCVKFTVIKIPTSGDPFLSCDLVLDRVSNFPTNIINPDADDIAFTPEDGYYEYSYITPPPTLPWLEVSPALKVVGEPLGPPLVGTPNAFFTVDIAIKNVTAEVDLIGIQNAALFYNNTLLRLNNPADPSANVSEGTFMNSALWAPFGTTFVWVEDVDYPSPGVNTISIGCIINPNTTTSEYDWPERPFGDGIFCTLHFEVIHQEEFPWEQTTALDLAPLFPDEMFLNSTEGWIPYLGPYDGEIKIRGYILGRMIDVYIGVECHAFPYPYGGQGINESADIVWAQKLICMWANVTYNMWPVQRKIVTFEILYPNGETLTVLSAITDDLGVAFASFRMPWPCDDPESLFGIWHIIASVDVACIIVKDHLWFHYDYLANLVKATIDPAQIGHCGWVTITVNVSSYALQEYTVLVTVDLKDELQVPIGFQALYLVIGNRDKTEWCHYKYYELVFRIHIPKHAFAGVAKAHVNILSELPSRCGAAYCPEIAPEFTILAKWE